jgi:hypothetical protein
LELLGEPLPVLRKSITIAPRAADQIPAFSVHQILPFLYSWDNDHDLMVNTYRQHLNFPSPTPQKVSSTITSDHFPMSVAEEFVRAYYAHLVYHPEELFKFYDQENATVWRSEVGDGVAVQFPQSLAFLVPAIDEGSKVTVTKFAALPLPSAISLVVHGTVVGPLASRAFVQVFTLSEVVPDRYFVVSDYLRFSGGPVDSDADVALIPGPSKAPEPAAPPPADPPRQSAPAEARPPRQGGRKGDRHQGGDAKPKIDQFNWRAGSS